MLALAIYVVPLCTNSLAYLFSEAEILETRPVKIIVISGGLALLGALPSLPRLAVPNMLLLCLLAVRFLDALIFRRIYDPLNYAMNVTGNSLFLLVILLFGLADERRHKLVVPFIILPCFVLTLGSMIWEVFSPGEFSNVAGRAAGLFVNSNNAASALSYICCYLMGHYWRRILPSYAFVILGVAGTFVTFSRGGFACMLLGVAIFALRATKWKKAVFVVAIFAAAATGLDQLSQLLTAGDQNIETRSQVMLGREKLEYDDTGRVRVLMEGIDLCLEQSILGFGSTYSVAPQKIDGLGPHNMIIAAWMDSGMLGLALFLACLALLLRHVAKRSREYLPLASVLVASSFFSHNLLDFPPFILFWVLVVHAASSSENQHSVLRGGISMPAASTDLGVSDRRKQGVPGINRPFNRI